MNWHKILEHIVKIKALDLPFMMIIVYSLHPIFNSIICLQAEELRIYRSRFGNIRQNDEERIKLSPFYQLLPKTSWTNT